MIEVSEEEFNQILQREIARELLAEKKIVLEEEELDKLLVLCKWNAWDVPIMHGLLELKKTL